MKRIMDSKNQLITTADNVDANALWRDYQASLGDYNGLTDDIVGALTFQTTDETSYVIQGAYQFEEYADYTLPDSHDLTTYHIHYGIKPWDLRLAYTLRRILNTSQVELDARHAAALMADRDLMVKWVLKSCFTKAGLTIEGVATYPFYNGDSVRTPPTWKNVTFTSAHTHYLATNSATLDGADLDAMEDHLVEHGFENNLELWINRAQRRTIMDLPDFVPARAYSHDAQLINLPGPPYIGQHGRLNIRIEDWVPPLYMFAYSRQGGQNSPQNPIALRIPLAESARGLKLWRGTNPEYPLVDSFYYHEFGTGCRQFGNGVCMQIVASSTYTSPTI
jgi:hypothetical protein